MPPPELLHLRAFAAVAEHRSYRRAATVLNLSASALSQHVRTLETALGQPLLNRSTRSVALTDAGRLLLERSAPALQALVLALQDVVDLGGALHGRLRLNVPRNAAQLVLQPVIKRLLQQHPTATVEVVTQDGLIDIVAQGFDAGVRFAPSLPQDMVAVPLGPAQRFALVAAPALVQCHGLPTLTEELQQLPCIVQRFPSGADYRWEFLHHAQTVALPVRGPLIVDDQTLALQAALDGIGWAYLYQGLAAPYIERGALVTHFAERMPAPERFQLYYPGKRQCSPLLRALIELVLAEETAPGR